VRSYGEPDANEPVRLMTFDVETRVKGDVPRQVPGIDERRIFVRVPVHTDCDLTVPAGETTGLLLTRLESGAWFASLCSVVPAGELVAVGGEPRGGPIKVAIGVVVLGLVLLVALVRLRRGSRPELPGAPR
jgi:MYXO-CTERM domain-containing protein